MRACQNQRNTKKMQGYQNQRITKKVSDFLAILQRNHDYIVYGSNYMKTKYWDENIKYQNIGPTSTAIVLRIFGRSYLCSGLGAFIIELRVLTHAVSKQNVAKWRPACYVAVYWRSGPLNFTHIYYINVELSIYTKFIIRYQLRIHRSVCIAVADCLPWCCF